MIKIIIENKYRIPKTAEKMPVLINDIPVGYISFITEEEITCYIWDDCFDYEVSYKDGQMYDVIGIILGIDNQNKER